MIDSGQGQNTTEDTFDRAQEAFDQGDFGTALTMFLQIAFSESDFDACYNAGNAAERLGDLRAAEALLRIAREAGVTDAGRNLAHILLNTDRRAAAIAAYREAAEAGDRNAAIDLGELHEEDGELFDALTWYRRAYDEPDAYLRVARVSRRLGDETGAVEALRLGSEVAGDAAAEYAEILYAQGNRQEALDVLWRASRIDPDRALVPLAYTLDEMGDIAGAERVLREAIARNDLYAHNNLAVILWNRGDEKEAIAHWKIGAQGGDEKASRALSRALESNPKNRPGKHNGKS